jgi:putative acetyltransferase
VIALLIEMKVYNIELQQDIDQFFEKCFTDLRWSYEPNGRHSDIANIQNSYMSNGCFWCIYDDSRLIGTVAVRAIDTKNEIAELKRLYVLKEEQGNGYGSMLFKTALNYARESKFHKICADTRYDRDASQHLMRKHGFDEVSKYNDNQFAELFFELKL